jgi:hypothetical integral membrane protein (TIGR02206 family)
MGWEHFGFIHIIYLTAFTLATLVLAIVYRKSKNQRRRRIRCFYAWTIVMLEVVKQFLCLFTGVYEPGLIPLHLCGMGIFIILVHTYHSNRWTSDLLYALVMPGAIAALLFSDWTSYPLANFYCQQSFFIHFFEFSYPVLLLAGGDLRPRLRELWHSAVYCLIVVPPVFVFNKVFGTNFFFINGAAPGSPLSFLANLLGDPGYLVGFAVMVILVWLVMYLPWTIADAISKRRELRLTTSTET